MPTILVSNNSELLRHLAAAPFRELDLALTVASSGEEALEIAEKDKPDLAILDAELPGVSGYEVARLIKATQPECSVVLVMGKRISGALMRHMADSGCDEVLVAPMSADELYDVVTIQLGLHRHGDERFTIDIVALTENGEHSLPGKVTNLSVDGARVVVREPVAEGSLLHLTIRFDDDADDAPIAVQARVVWSQHRDRETVLGAQFEGLESDVRNRLAELTQWEIVDDTERTRIVIKGDLTEAISLESLLPDVVGRIDFDMSQVRYMNSLGVQKWVYFLENANAQGYEFHACSIPFIWQASMVSGVLGRGTVASFFAPYHCDSCDRHENKLLQSAAVLAADCQPPVFVCSSCDGEMSLDDIPERYFAFLKSR